MSNPEITKKNTAKEDDPFVALMWFGLLFALSLCSLPFACAIIDSEWEKKRDQYLADFNQDKFFETKVGETLELGLSQGKVVFYDYDETSRHKYQLVFRYLETESRLIHEERYTISGDEFFGDIDFKDLFGLPRTVHVFQIEDSWGQKPKIRYQVSVQTY